MKNREKYKGQNVKAEQQFKINGCGKKIQSTREIVITLDNKELKRVKTQEDIVDVFFKWLDEESL